MNTSFSRIMATVLALMIGVSMSLNGNAFVQGQDHTASPVATPATSQVTKFSLNPVGDSSKSYFDDVEIQPGSSITLEAVLLNFGDGPVELRLYVTNATSGVNGGYVADQRAAELFGSARWITFPEQEMALQPGEAVTITLVVTVPAGTEPGQYISSLVAETVDTFPIPGMDFIEHRIRFAMAVGILVPGELHHLFTLGEPTMNPDAIVIPLTNTGNYLVRPAGAVEFLDSQGEVVISGSLEIGSVYAGLTTNIAIPLPTGLRSGEYTLSLSLKDPGSGASASIDSARVSLRTAERPAQFALGDYAIEPNAEEIAFANVRITLNNNGQQVPAASVILIVSLNGQLVEEFPIATNQVLVNGENVITSRYIPATDWEPGTYTFVVVVEAVDPNGGQQTVLLDVPLEAEIVIP